MTLLLGDISVGVGHGSAALLPIAALVVLVAAVVFAVLDWPGLPSKGVEVPAADRMPMASRRTGR